MHITELRLMTDCLLEQRDFYTHILGLSLLSETETSVTVQVGTTHLVFLQAEQGMHPFYHFAFNIPSNKFAEAKEWLALRCSLLEMNGVDQVTHQAWNAQSFYFYDPAGNVVELISRYNLSNNTNGAFDARDLLNVSEIGLVVEDVLAVVDSIDHFTGEKVWKEKSEVFTAVGDDNGLLIIAISGRIWLLTDKPAEVYPVVITIQGAIPLSYTVADLPYNINIVVV